jgi:hypothetical protein
MTTIALEQEKIHEEFKAVKSARLGLGDTEAEAEGTATCTTEPFVPERLFVMLENAWAYLVDFGFQAKAAKTMSEGLVQPGSTLDDMRKSGAREIMEELDEIVLQGRKDVEELGNVVWATKGGLEGL